MVLRPRLGGEALHASAVLVAKGVVAFAGPAGSGKSTLAGSFVKLGYPFFSDDCLRLKEEGGNIHAIPFRALCQAQGIETSTS